MWKYLILNLVLCVEVRCASSLPVDYYTLILMPRHSPDCRKHPWSNINSGLGPFKHFFKYIERYLVERFAKFSVHLKIQIYDYSLRELAVKLGCVRVVNSAANALKDYKVTQKDRNFILFNVYVCIGVVFGIVAASTPTTCQVEFTSFYRRSILFCE